MGGRESSQIDSSYFEKGSFHLNILKEELENIKIYRNNELSYYKKSTHINIP